MSESKRGVLVKELVRELERVFDQSGLTVGERLVLVAWLARSALTGLVPFADDAAIALTYQELNAVLDGMEQWMLRQKKGGDA